MTMMVKCKLLHSGARRDNKKKFFFSKYNPFIEIIFIVNSLYDIVQYYRKHKRYLYFVYIINNFVFWLSHHVFPQVSPFH